MLYLSGYSFFICSTCAIHSVCSISSSLVFRALRISLTSPITLASTRIFLLISAGSISSWRIRALGANLLVSPVTRSENLAPTTTRRSHSITAKLEVLVPCMPSIPVYLGSVPLKAPFPINESATGASILDANSASSSWAPEIMAPPPTKIKGFSASFIIDTASLTASLVICAVSLDISAGLT